MNQRNSITGSLDQPQNEPCQSHGVGKGREVGPLVDLHEAKVWKELDAFFAEYLTPLADDCLLQGNCQRKRLPQK